jgi:pre-mRNA-processing factor 6
MAANNKPNKLAFLSMPAPASYVAGLGRGYAQLNDYPTKANMHSSVPLVSRLVQISVLRVRDPPKKSLRTHHLYFPFKFTYSCISSEARAKRGEEPDMDSEQFQDPDNEFGLFAGGAYEQDDEEADKIYEQVDTAMDSRRKQRRCVLG